MTSQTRGFIALCAGVLLASSAHAATTVYTDQAAFVAAAGNVAFDSFEDLTREVNVPVGSIDRAGYSVTASLQSDDEGLYVFDGPAGFGAFATDGDTYLVHQTDSRERLRFDFDTPVHSFGLSITDWDNPLMTSGAQLLFGNDAGDKLVVTATPQLDGTALFFGIVNSDAAFTYVEFGGGAANEAYGVDGVFFGSPVPLPAAVWLLGSALGGLLSLRRKQINMAT